MRPFQIIALALLGAQGLGCSGEPPPPSIQAGTTTTAGVGGMGGSGAADPTGGGGVGGGGGAGGAGGACGAWTEPCCGGVQCDKGLWCKDGVCRPYPQKGKGEACFVGDDCKSGVCETATEPPSNPPEGWMGKVCVRSCDTDANCTSGWTCAPAATTPGKKTCHCGSPSLEICDGKDNDCDGYIDSNPSELDAWCVATQGPNHVCGFDGCKCLLTCGAACLDPKTVGSPGTELEFAL